MYITPLILFTTLVVVVEKNKGFPSRFNIDPLKSYTNIKQVSHLLELKKHL